MMATVMVEVGTAYRLFSDCDGNFDDLVDKHFMVDLHAPTFY